MEIDVGALVLQRHEVGDQRALRDLAAALQLEGHRRIGLDRADAVDARHRGDDDHVVALEQRARRRVAHAVDLLVDGGFLLDIGVGARHVGFRLVVVVVADEILDRVVREEALELAIELGGERLVGRENQRRALRPLDHLRHGVGFARAGDAEEHLGALAFLHALHQDLDRLRLVALRLEGRDEVEQLAALEFLRALGPVGNEIDALEFRPAGFEQAAATPRRKRSSRWRERNRPPRARGRGFPPDADRRQ